MEDFLWLSVFFPKAGGLATSVSQTPSQNMGTEGQGLRFRVLVCLAAGLTFSGSATAHAQGVAPRCDVEIAEPTLGPALVALATQCGVSLLYPYELAGTRGIRPVKGRRTVTEALKIMLLDKPLTGQLTKSGVITISQSGAEGDVEMPRSNRTSLLAGASALIMSLVGANVVHADEANKVDKPVVVDELVVTASKRAVTIQDLPQSITAMTGQDLAARGIENYEDLTRTVPGVIATGGSNFNKFVVRGIQTSNGTSSSGEQKLVAIYLDDLPLTSFSVVTPDVRPYDIARVEVLRGPQGTLFGSGSLAGAIRYITNKPDSTGFHGSLDVDIGQTKGDSNRRRISGMVNIPLIEDQLAARIVGYSRDEDGWVNYAGAGRKNTNTAKDWGVRGSLRWTPTDRFSATLMVTSDHNDVGDSSLYDPTLGRNIAKRDFPFQVDVDVNNYNLSAEYDLGWADLTSSTVYATAKTGWNLDLDGVLTAFLPYYFQEHIDTKSVVEDARLVSKKGGKIDWVAGLFYLDQESDYADVFNTSQAFLDSLKLTGLTPILSPNPDLSHDLRSKKNFEAALYGELNYHLTETLTVTGGLRASQYEFSDQGVGGSSFTTPTFVPLVFNALFGGGGAVITKVPTGLTVKNTTGKQSKVIGKLGVDWKPSADQTFYALASQGFRRSHPNGPSASNGGKSVINPSDPAIIPVMAEADSLWNYEVGSKSILLDGRLRSNLAVYYIDWGPMQVPLVRSSDATPYVGTVGKSRSIGLEAEFDARITSQLDAGLNLTFQNAEVTDLTPTEALISGAVVGAQLASPDFKAGGYVKYGWTLANGSEMYGRLDGQYVGSYVNTFPNTAGAGTPNAAFAKIPSYTNINASFGWSQGNLTASAYAENLTNNQSVIFIDAANYSLNRYSTLRPRTLGLRLGWKY